MPKADAPSPEEEKYRDQLQQLAHDAQDNYDKTVVTLSGGALGVSFAFVKNVVGTHALSCPWWLLVAWLAWAISVGATLWSYYTSHAAMQMAVKRWDDGKRLRQELVGQPDRWTSLLNAAAGICFVFGVVAMAIFAVCTLEASNGA
jgi:hypothetical protein